MDYFIIFMNNMTKYFDLWSKRYRFLTVTQSFIFRKTDLFEFIEEFHKLLQLSFNAEVPGYFIIKSEHIQFTIFIKFFNQILIESFSQILSNDSIGYTIT